MDAEQIIAEFGDWIHEEQNEDGYGMPTSGTYWYCEICDETHGTPDAITHRNTCSVGKAIKVANALEAANARLAADNKALRERAEKAELRVTALTDAGVWLLHLANDVGKAGGKPEPGEWEDAWDTLKTALSGAVQGGGE